MKKKSLVYTFIIFLFGVIYVSQYWSPSSYGLVLRQLGVKDVGTVVGEPRSIRSDEWGVVTPLTQATINNNFERFNKTSIYREDLRMNYGLPIFDWGLIFKPTMWAYLFVDAAHAYSFHWFSVLALFIVGYALLFVTFGLSEKQSILLSVGLYFTGFAQFWWSEKGPEFALFPWVVWVLLLRIPIGIRLLLFYWFGTSWLITNFYPPVFLSLAFVGACILLAAGREWLSLKKFILLMFTAGASALTAAVYLKDYLLKTSTTVYPGGRNVGGGSVPWQEWWAQFFPFGTFDWYYQSQSPVGQNICEVGVVGAPVALMLVCFLNYGKILQKLREHADFRMRIMVLGSGLALMTAWLLLPLPAWAGVPFLWNHVQPERMEYAAGTLLLLTIAVMGKEAGVVITTKRVLAYLAAVIVGWAVLKQISLDTPLDSTLMRSNDLIVIPVFISALVINAKLRIPKYSILLGTSTISSAIVLFGFNPIQSTKDFFSRHDTPLIRQIEELWMRSDDYLAFPGMFGATLNGLGYPSVSHVTPVPDLDFWRRKYPSMKEEKFLEIFNRYSHIQLIPGDKPVLFQDDLVGVPLKDFPAVPSEKVEVPVNIVGPAKPFWLHQNHSVTGEFISGRAGQIKGAGIFIGNEYNNSDGILFLKLCNAGSCRVAERDLAASFDNSYLDFKLNQPLIIDASEAVQYELQLREGSKRVALWTYQQLPSKHVTFMADGQIMPLVPRFHLTYFSESKQ